MSTDTSGRIFSPWARRTIAGFAIVVGLVLALSAADQGGARKFAAALVCFVIAAANLMPPRHGKWLSRSVALVLILFSGYFVAHFQNGSTGDKYSAIAAALLLGLPGLLYLAAGARPFVFIGKRRDKSPERAREE